MKRRSCPAEAAPAIFLPEPARAAYFAAGARALNGYASRPESIAAALIAARRTLGADTR